MKVALLRVLLKQKISMTLAPKVIIIRILELRNKSPPPSNERDIYS